MAAIDYTPPPTIGRFVQSEKFHNFVVGPVGPVSGDTEFLTPAGWKRVDQYIPGDLVAQWTPDPNGDPAQGVMEWVAPLDYIVTSADTLLHFRNENSLSMMLSDAHRVPYYDYQGKLQVTTAGDAAQAPSIRQIPTAFVPRATSGTGLSPDVLRLAVAIHADGHFPAHTEGSTAHPARCIVTVRKERKKERLRRLLAAVAVEWTERVYDSRPTESVFSFRSPYVGKTFNTQRWWGATHSELLLVMEELPYWDGLHEGADIRFSTALKGDADFVQYAAHATGGRATIARCEYPKHPNWRPTYTVHIADANSRKRCVNVSRHTEIDRVPAPGGKQYCFQTPSTFFLARHDGRVFITGNSSKTTGILFKILYHACRQAPSPVDNIRYTKWVVVRNTGPQLKDTTLASFFKWFVPGVAGEWRSTNMSFLFRFADVHCEVLFRPLDTPDDVSRVLSLEVTGAVLDEFIEIPKEIVEALSGRCGRYPQSPLLGACTWWGMWGASNPGNEDDWWWHWLYEPWAEAPAIPGLPAATKDQLLGHFEQAGGFDPAAENIENLPGQRSYYANLAVGKTPEWVERYINARWGFSLKGTPIYKGFNPDLHVAKTILIPDPALPVIIGLDAGLTPAAVFMQQTLYGQRQALDEAVEFDMGAKRFAKQRLAPLIQARYADCALIVVCDPAAKGRAQTDEKTVASTLEDELGLPVVRAWTNNLTARLDAVDDTLSRLTPRGPELVISPHLKWLITACRTGYRWKLTTKQERSDSPDKNKYSHVAEALQYGVMGFQRGKHTEAQERANATGHSPILVRNHYTLGT